MRKNPEGSSQFSFIHVRDSTERKLGETENIIPVLFQGDGTVLHDAMDLLGKHLQEWRGPAVDTGLALHVAIYTDLACAGACANNWPVPSHLVNVTSSCNPFPTTFFPCRWNGPFSLSGAPGTTYRCSFPMCHSSLPLSPRTRDRVPGPGSVT